MGTQHSCTVGGMRWGLGGRKGSASAYHASPSINIILRLLTAYVQPFPVIFFPQNQNCLEIYFGTEPVSIAQDTTAASILGSYGRQTVVSAACPRTGERSYDNN